MKRIGAGLGLFVAVVLLAGGGLYGDDKKDDKVKGTLPPNWGKLGLTDVQKQQVYKTQKEHRDKIADLESQIKKLKEGEKEELLKVLTPEQKARLKEIINSKAGDKTEKTDK
jgi:hypothetical protein